MRHQFECISLVLRLLFSEYHFVYQQPVMAFCSKGKMHFLRQHRTSV